MAQLKTFILSNELLFILLNSDSSEVLVKSNDGLSISNKESDIKDEMKAFDEIFDKSRIANKLKVLVNSGNQFRPKEDIFKEVTSFIESV